MRDETMSRSWKAAVLASVAGMGVLAFGLFLAIGKDTLADDESGKVKVYESNGDDGVKVIRVVSGDGPEAQAEMAYEDALSGDEGKGGYLGIDSREYTKSDDGGAYVQMVIDGSPADKAGVKEGDVIVGFNGEVVRGPGKLTEKIHAAKPGDKIKLDVKRDGKPVSLQVTIGDRPKPMVWSWNGKTTDWGALSEDQQKAVEKSLKELDKTMPQLRQMGKFKVGPGGRHYLLGFNNKPLLGVEMVETTPELRETLGGTKDSGVLIGKVLPGSAAEKAGLRVGDLVLSIDGTKVADSGDLMDAIRDREGKTIDMDVVRDHKSMHFKANLPKTDEQEDPPTGPRASRLAPLSRKGLGLGVGHGLGTLTTALRGLLSV
ncbi:MAG TPA: PDZ domain-containing protein [Candidatus Polarisedimenticolaceae bacterium]|nr:PDZ domain-containing protein [Candidatus Polarisedimenticolaceae bacterium]